MRLGFGLEDSFPGRSVLLPVAVPNLLVLIVHIIIGHVRLRQRLDDWSKFRKRNNQQVHIKISRFITIRVASHNFRSPTVIFKSHLPDDSYNRWPKYVGGYTLYIYIYIYIYVSVYAFITCLS